MPYDISLQILNETEEDIYVDCVNDNYSFYPLMPPAPAELKLRGYPRDPAFNFCISM